MSYTVIVCDMFHFANDPEHEIEIPGFPRLEVAIEYARRRLRSSLEALRKPEQSPKSLREMWYTFGEDCRVTGPEGVVYLASSELAHFIRNPAPPEACDYLALYESLLPEDFALTCTWAAGSVPPPYHYEYRIVVHLGEPPAGDGETRHVRLQGEMIFWPDYPGPSVPAWKETFTAGMREALRVYALLQDGGLLSGAPPRREADAPVGGETLALQVTVQGRMWRIHSPNLPAEQADFLRVKVLPAVRAMVPTHIWKHLEARRQTYRRGAKSEA